MVDMEENLITKNYFYFENFFSKKESIFFRKHFA